MVKKNKKMKLLKINYFFLLVFIAISCKSQKENTTITNVNAKESYYQYWTAGVRGGGSGIDIHLKFKEPLDKETTLEKVQILNLLSNQITKIDENNYLAAVKTEGNQRILDENPENEYGNTPPIFETKAKDTLPQGTLKLFFKSNGKTIIKTLENIKQKELLAYP